MPDNTHSTTNILDDNFLIMHMSSAKIFSLLQCFHLTILLLLNALQVF